MTTGNVKRKGRTRREVASNCANRLLLAYQYRQCGLTLKQVGEKLNVSQERARQLICKYENTQKAPA